MSNGLSMRQVYIRLDGDIALPSMWHAFDAKTGVEIRDVQSAYLEVGVNRACTNVCLNYTNGSTELCEVIVGPPTKKVVPDGTHLIELELEHRPLDPTADEYILRAKRYVTTDDKVARNAAHDTVTMFRVDRAVLATHTNPKDFLNREMIGLGRMLGADLAAELVRRGASVPFTLPTGGMVKKKQPATGGVVRPPNFGGVPAKKCAECNGTGQWENPISGQRSPCKSCKGKP